MSTSISERIVLTDEGLYGDAGEYMDSVLMRRVVANNLHHAADSMGQVRVNYWPVKAFGGNHATYLETDGVDETGRWYLFGGMPMGPWPLTLRADGTPYRLVIRMAAAVTSDLGRSNFRVIIAPSYASALEGLYEFSDRVYQVSNVFNTTAMKVTGTSQGSAGSSTYLDVPRSLATSWITDVPTFDAVSGGTPVTVQACMVSAWVFAKSTHVSSDPYLYGLHLHEYIAP